MQFLQNFKCVTEKPLGKIIYIWKIPFLENVMGWGFICSSAALSTKQPTAWKIKLHRGAELVLLLQLNSCGRQQLGIQSFEQLWSNTNTNTNTLS